MIRNAHICIECCAVPKDPNRRIRKCPVSRSEACARLVRRLLDSSSHQFARKALGYKCARCHVWAKSGAHNFYRRLKSTCPVTLPSSPPPAPDPVVARRRKVLVHPPVDEGLWIRQGLDPAPFRVQQHFLAGKALHPSHELWQKGRFTFCGRCGCWLMRSPGTCKRSASSRREARMLFPIICRWALLGSDRVNPHSRALWTGVISPALRPNWPALCVNPLSSDVELVM